jgi:hypothetical protein
MSSAQRTAGSVSLSRTHACTTYDAKDWKSAIEIQESWYQCFFFKALWQDYPAVSIE